ncbi:cdc42 effector protein 3 [Echeneis naucrates]|uniref:Cdc42 effector protein 3-like n=1 Tax=Echeneis naucrates TaxID=173247 RepID=A0A665VG00_ECHNA|nr:cdc42 effector protein 3-like [Echeneis naucrates]
MPFGTSLHRKAASGRWPGRNSKRREVLSINMISLPLADFRHISHIGSNAFTDSFGDLSFLKMGHSLLLQSSQSEQNLFMACSPPPKPPRLNLDEAGGSESPNLSIGWQDKTPQKRKKSSSMPLLDSEDIEELAKEDEYQRGHNAPYNQTHNFERGSVSSDKDGDSSEICDKTDEKPRDEDSGFSFSLDLGPSILDDVLRVMDNLHN